MEDFNEKDLKHALRAVMRQRLKKQLQLRETSVHVAKKNAKWPFLLILGIIITAILIFLLKPEEAKNNGDLFIAFFEPIPNVYTPSVRGEAALFEEAFKAYDEHDFEKAVALFSKIQSQDEAICLYQGIAYLAIQDPHAALRLFERIQDKKYRTSAQWYTGLAYLKLDKMEEANRVFDSIIQKEDHIFRQEALDIIRRLNK